MVVNNINGGECVAVAIGYKYEFSVKHNRGVPWNYTLPELFAGVEVGDAKMLCQ
jgi:hypothetical protein